MRKAEHSGRGIRSRAGFVIAAIVTVVGISVTAPSAFRFNVGSAAGAQEESKKREARLKEERMREEKEKGEISFEERTERRRVEIEKWVHVQTEIARITKLSMEQALQIAASQQAGMPIECRLGRENDEAVYNIVVFSGGDPDTALTRLQVSARDGKVLVFERIRP